jgi:hypothetical protein
MDRMFDTYGELLTEVQAWLTRRHPRQAADSDFVHRRAVRAKALDALRGLLPAGSLSNLGIYGTGQSYEMLLLRMRSHPLPEARSYAAMMLAELRKVIPSFLQRVDRPERGGVWSRYLEQVRDDTARAVERLFPDLVEPAAASSAGPSGARRSTWSTSTPRGRKRCSPLSATPTRQYPKTRFFAGCAGSAPTNGGRCCSAMWVTGPTAVIGPDEPLSEPPIDSMW